MTGFIMSLDLMFIYLVEQVSVFLNIKYFLNCSHSAHADSEGVHYNIVLIPLICNSNLCFNITESAATDKHTGCFTAQSKVVREDGRVVNMSQVNIGDKIQSMDSQGNIVFSEVLMFMDREPEETMRFISLTGDDGSVITLTPSHLVYSGAPDCQSLECMVPTYAGNVERGHTLVVTRDNVISGVVTVASVSVTKHTGVYAPLTRAGNVVVDNVLASCYAVVDSQNIAHAAFAPVRWYYSIKDATVSMLTSINMYSATAESVPRTLVTGVHWYPDMLYSIARFVMPSHLVTTV